MVMCVTCGENEGTRALLEDAGPPKVGKARRQLQCADCQALRTCGVCGAPLYAVSIQLDGTRELRPYYGPSRGIGVRFCDDATCAETGLAWEAAIPRDECEVCARFGGPCPRHWTREEAQQRAEAEGCYPCRAAGAWGRCRFHGRDPEPRTEPTAPDAEQLQGALL